MRNNHGITNTQNRLVFEPGTSENATPSNPVCKPLDLGDLKIFCIINKTNVINFSRYFIALCRVKVIVYVMVETIILITKKNHH